MPSNEADGPFSTARYTGITETSAVKASREQLSILYTRYRFAAQHCRDCDVLEVACGAGLGLGYLQRVARSVIGGDIDDANVERATAHYQGRPGIRVCRFDAHELPFADASVDRILLYEALYYLRDPDQFLRECRRVLRPGGMVLISSVNCEWPDFNPSPFCTKYFSADALAALLRVHRFDPALFVSFPARTDTAKAKLISAIRRTAVALRLIPHTMKGKEWLKRIFIGELVPLPAEVTDDFAPWLAPQPLDAAGPVRGYKMLYAAGRLT